jgi:hypothetical protein
VEGHKVRAYDLGGKQRDIWSDYLVSSGCVVFVVDASDPERFPESKAELDVRLRLLFLFFFFSFFLFFFFSFFFLFSFFSFFLLFFFFLFSLSFSFSFIFWGPLDLGTRGPWDIGTLGPWGPSGPWESFVYFFYFFLLRLLCAHLPGLTFERGPVRRAVRRVREQVRPGRGRFRARAPRRDGAIVTPTAPDRRVHVFRARAVRVQVGHALGLALLLIF